MKKGFRGILFMPIKWTYLLIGILIFILFARLFYPTIENFFLFFPDSSLDYSPKEMSLHYEDVYFNTPDGTKLSGWFFPLEIESPIILFCHGNAGNISHRLDLIRLLLENGLQVFIFDYRGYGKSEGAPSRKGLYQDGLSAYDYLIQKRHIPPSNIILLGRSLGAAVAIDISLNREVKSIVVESGFTSIKEMAKTMFLFAILSPIIPSNYNNLEKIAGVKVPKLVIHGNEDEIVPYYMGRELYHAAQEPKYFFEIDGSGHNDTYLVGRERYFQTIVGFAMDSKI